MKNQRSGDARRGYTGGAFSSVEVLYSFIFFACPCRVNVRLSANLNRYNHPLCLMSVFMNASTPYGTHFIEQVTQCQGYASPLYTYGVSPAY